MALFGRKKASASAEASADKEEKSKKVEVPASVAMSPSSSASNDLSHVLRNPRITEKATTHQERGVYTFDVHDHATKSEIATAVRALYGVAPRKVHIVPVPSKEKRNVRTGARGVTRGGKKAYVYLKKGETITIT